MSDGKAVAGVVRRVWKETPYLTGVVLEVAESVAQQYVRAGQVVAVRPDHGEHPLYLAIASAPGEARAIELLLGDVAAGQMPLTEGATWRFDPPFGEGYPVEIAEGRDVLLFTVGSGLASLRPVVETLRRTRGADLGTVIVYVGAHTPNDFPYEEDLRAWAAEGISIRRTVSKPWVQDVFRADPPPLDNAVAFLCGMPAMVQGVREALLEAGMPADRIGVNW